MGTISSAALTTRKEILVTTLVGLCSAFRIFDIRIDIPIDDNIITEIAPNISNLINAEPAVSRDRIGAEVLRASIPAGPCIRGTACGGRWARTYRKRWRNKRGSIR